MGISVRAMAAHIGVSKSQVQRDKAAGMPMHDVAAARQWRLQHHDLSRTVDGRIDRPGPAADATPAPASLAAAAAPGDDADEPADDASADTLKFRQARATREQVNAQRAQIELDQLRGSLIALDDAKRLAYTAFRALRDAVLNVPARVRDQLAIETDPAAIERLLEAELAGALQTLTPEAVLRDTDDDDDTG